MTEDNSILFQNEDTSQFSNLQNVTDSDFVDQMDSNDQKDLKKKIFQGVRIGIQKQEEKIQKQKRILHNLKVAASILLFLTLNYGLWQSIKLNVVSYQTGANETLHIDLPDGSYALLNSNSSLSYTYNMTVGFERKVELTGEAFFDIAKDPSAKRFVINEGDVLEVEVFGTEFNFKNQYPIHKLTLIEGSVKLSYQGEEGNTDRMVKPGETVKFNVENSQIEAKTIAEPQRLLAWQDKKIRMQNESLEGVLGIVTELYDLELINQKTPPTYKLISGSLPLTDDPNDVIENIEVLFDTKILLEQNIIRVQ